MKPRAAPTASLSPARVVGLAALLGVVMGTALSVRRTRQLDEALEVGMPAAVVKAVPQGAPATPTDMMAPDPRSLEGIPPYPGVSPRRMFDGTTLSNGVGAVSWFETQDSVETVLKFYERAFAAEKHNSVTGRPSTKRGFVAWFDHQVDAEGNVVFGEGTMHMVTVSDENSRRMVFMSANEPMRILEQGPTLPAGVRFPPGPKPHVVRVGEVEQEHATIFAEYRKGEVDDVAGQFERLAREDGWTLAKRTTEVDGSISMTLGRGAFVQVASVHKINGGAELLTSVEQTHEAH